MDVHELGQKAELAGDIVVVYIHATKVHKIKNAGGVLAERCAGIGLGGCPRAYSKNKKSRITSGL
jgi:hypothetical protein